MNAGHAHPKPPSKTAPTTQDNPQAGAKREEGERLSAVVGKCVMATLGEPPLLHAVQVRWLWEDHYRVNVFVGVDAASAKVANSFFLVADNDGKIITSWPTIRREYPPLVRDACNASTN